MLEIALLAAGALFALNMGGSGLAPAFSMALGAGLIERRRAIVLFTLLVTGGAVAFGGAVAKTLGGELVPSSAFDGVTTLCALCAAAGALWIANALHIPLSTSWVAVGVVAAVGIHHGGLNDRLILVKLLPAWIGLPLLAFVLTYVSARRFYPLRASNMQLHERLPSHEKKLRWATIASSCYVAAAIGANNVANVVGPLAATGAVDVGWGMLLFGPIFGLGAMLLGGPTDTVGKGLVPIGLLTATVVNVVVGSLCLAASLIGIPQPLVQISTASVLAVSRVKEGAFELMEQRALRKIGLVWLASPIVAVSVTWLLLELVRVLR